MVNIRGRKGNLHHRQVACSVKAPPKTGPKMLAILNIEAISAVYTMIVISPEFSPWPYLVRTLTRPLPQANRIGNDDQRPRK